jgi:hypothetical protein
MSAYDAFTNAVLARKEGHVLTVSLNRPAQRNAVNSEIHNGLRDVFALAAADDDVRAIVLRGEGKAFCAGGDVGTMEGSGTKETPSPAIRVRETLDAARIVEMILSVPQPTVCALHGFAMGLGATAVGWNGVFLAELTRLAPRDRIADVTGGCSFFTFLGVVLSPPLFHFVLRMTADYGMSYALFGLAPLAAGVLLLLTAKILRDERYS